VTVGDASKNEVNSGTERSLSFSVKLFKLKPRVTCSWHLYRATDFKCNVLVELQRETRRNLRKNCLSAKGSCKEKRGRIIDLWSLLDSRRTTTRMISSLSSTVFFYYSAIVRDDIVEGTRTVGRVLSLVQNSRPSHSTSEFVFFDLSKHPCQHDVHVIWLEDEALVDTSTSLAVILMTLLVMSSRLHWPHTQENSLIFNLTIKWSQRLPQLSLTSKNRIQFQVKSLRRISFTNDFKNENNRCRTLLFDLPDGHLAR
jgi:hypothetical protein